MGWVAGVGGVGRGWGGGRECCWAGMGPGWAGSRASLGRGGLARAWRPVGGVCGGLVGWVRRVGRRGVPAPREWLDCFVYYVVLCVGVWLPGKTISGRSVKCGFLCRLGILVLKCMIVGESVCLVVVVIFYYVLCIMILW